MSYLTWFILSFLLFGVALVVSLFREKRSPLFYKIVLIPPVCASGIAFLTLVIQSGHLPSHYLFERFVELAFTVGVVLWVVSFYEDTRRVIPYVLTMIGALFTVSLFFPMHPSPLIFRFSLPMAQLFFQLEAVAFVFIVFSSAYYLVCLLEGDRLPNTLFYIQRGRRYLLIGFTVFLASQFFGSLWSLQGWGDYWMFGKMSSIGVVMWFYLMFVIHTRYVAACGRTFESSAGSLLFAMVVVYTMVWQP